MYPRNAASPNRIAIGPVVQISDGAVQTSGVTVRIIPEGGSETDGGGSVAYSTDGIVLYTPTQSETNYTSFILIAKKSGCIPASVTVVTTGSSTAGTVNVSTISSANAPANWINASAIAASALNGKGDWLSGLGTNAPSGWINAAAIGTGAITAAKVAADAWQAMAKQLLGISGTVWFVMADGNDTTGDGLTPDTAFALPSKAAGEAGTGDAILVGPGEYDQGTTQIALPASCLLKGSGRSTTRITGAGSYTVNGPTIKPGAGCTIEDMRVTNTYDDTDDNSIGACIGIVSGHGETAVNHVNVRRVDFVGQGDCLLLEDGSGSFVGWRFEDCTFTSRWDTCMVSADDQNTSRLEFLRCQFLVNGASPLQGQLNARAVVTNDGTIRLVDCDITATGHLSGNFGLRLTASGTRIEAYHCRISTSGTGASDVLSANGATILLHDCTFDPATVVTATGGTVLVHTTPVGNVAGDVAGKVLGGGSGTIAAAGVWALDGSGNAILDAAGVRTAVGMADADLDDQLSDIRAAADGAQGAAQAAATDAATLAGMTEDSAGRRFTAKALETAPSGTGGDATLAKQEEILTAIGNINAGTGSGPNTVAVTVTDGTDPVQAAAVSLTKGVDILRGISDAQGRVTFNAEPGQWTVAIYRSGYSFSGATLNVDGDADVEYEIQAISVSPPSSPADCTVYFIAYRGGTVLANTAFIFRRAVTPYGTGNVYVGGMEREVTSDGSGLVQVELPRGSQWDCGVAVGSGTFRITVPDADTFEIPNAAI